MSSQDTTERIRRMRLAANYGQVEFAQLAGVASGSVSNLERDLARVSPEVLTAAARTLDCSPAFLARDSGVLSTRPWFRAYVDASKRAMAREVADAELAVEMIEILRLQRIPDGLPTFHDDVRDEDAIEQFAADVRLAAGLDDDSSVPNVTRAVERLGCVVLPMNAELGRHLGVSLRINGVPVVRVSRPSADPDHDVPGDRQRFTLAHELAHLTLHAESAAPADAKISTEIEKQAHRFAGAFLCPADPLLAELAEFGGRVTLRTLAFIKERWGVAIKMLVKRFHDLGVIDDDHARSLYKQISSRGWNKMEPVLVGNETAVWLATALQRRATSGRDVIDFASAETGLGRPWIARWLDWSRVESRTSDADVVALVPRTRQRAPQDRDGTVTPLR